MKVANGFAVESGNPFEQMDAGAKTLCLCGTCDERVRGHQVQRVSGGAQLPDQVSRGRNLGARVAVAYYWLTCGTGDYASDL